MSIELSIPINKIQDLSRILTETEHLSDTEKKEKETVLADMRFRLREIESALHALFKKAKKNKKNELVEQLEKQEEAIAELFEDILQEPQPCLYLNKTLTQETNQLKIDKNALLKEFIFPFSFMVTGITFIILALKLPESFIATTLNFAAFLLTVGALSIMALRTKHLKNIFSTENMLLQTYKEANALLPRFIVIATLIAQIQRTRSLFQQVCAERQPNAAGEEKFPTEQLLLVHSPALFLKPKKEAPEEEDRKEQTLSIN
ncbi:MAG: hypothetical protein ACD_44C00290G0005 [uncultured bacterium]|nr:MAG: hypothetical protein ACD_44C00290G0005 [uncultured bacterium]OGT24868.1 MAG: hypothetical protein A2W47_07420 [Gammaproteobacteria bacterium RIFCSPHIGHO2_12_38_15]OGT69099.1 MAG: hypothetical protein A3I12_06005 [Gammaproteobacteria bacterium RIFCSPLOWO2_02_FULL_38_11]OGT76481.1 MAG: hypothetical protein A3G71_05685 [Gammaproteobacteria bacterium RIFCSPLOWO2_12_FULL_38_14]